MSDPDERPADSQPAPDPAEADRLRHNAWVEQAIEEVEFEPLKSFLAQLLE